MSDPTPREPERGPDEARPMPAPGPHAEPDLLDPDKTPGDGTLPDPGESDVGAPTD